MKAIVNELVTSDIVLAVLTDFNPNVLYELGTRHSLKHGTIMMLERGQDIPFDIKQYGVIYYDDKVAAVLKFEEDLRDAVQEIESDGPDSPVLDFLNKRETSFNETRSPSDKLSVADRRQVIYNDLDKNIFSPLLDYELETPYDYPISRLKLYYDLSSLKENADYEEAKLHWEQDLKDIGIDPEVIEAQVNGLNKDVEMFLTSQIREPVIAAITTGGIFTAFESRTDVPPLNHISIPSVIKELQSDWIENTRVNQRYEEDTHHYILGGGQIIATIEPQDETRLKDIINDLRSNSSIRRTIQGFSQRKDTILDDVKKLNSEINKRIVNQIRKKLYILLRPFLES